MNSDKLDMKTPDLMLGNIQRIAELVSALCYGNRGGTQNRF